MGSPVIWNGSTGKNLSSSGMKAKNGRQELYLEVDPRATATAGNQGDFLSSIYGKFQKLDSGTTTNWKRIDVEFSPYKVYDNFELNSGDGFVDPKWIAYGNTNAALSYPDNFGGAAGPTSGTTSASTDLSGAFVLRLNVTNLMNGKGAYRSFSISNGEKGLPFIFETQINVTKTGSTEWASNAQVWVVGSNDNFVANFQNIPLTNYVVSKSGLLKGSFIDSSSTLTNFRLCIHFSGLTDTFNVDFDEVKIYQSNTDTLSPNSKKVVSSWGYKAGMGGGNASTNTKIAYMTGVNIVEQGGSIYDYFTYAPSTTLGDSWTAKSSFKLAVHIGNDVLGAIGTIGISINSTELTTNFQSVNDNNRMTVTGYGDVAVCSGERIIQKGDVLRVHVGGSVTFNPSEYFRLIFSIDENTGLNVIASSENFMPIKVVIPSQSVGAGATEIAFTTAGDTRFTTSARFKLPSNGRYLITLTYVHSAFPQWLNFDVRKNGVALTGTRGNYRDMPSNITNFNQGLLVLDTTGDSDSDYYSVWVGGQSSVTIGNDGNSNMQVDRLDKPFSMNLFQAAGMVLSPTDNVLPAKFKNSATQSLIGNTLTILNIDTTVKNPTGNFVLSSNRIYYYGNAGTFKIGHNASVALTGAGSMNYYSVLYKNGVAFETLISGSITNGEWDSPLNSQCQIDLVNGDYIDIRCSTSVSTDCSNRSITIERVDKTAVSAGGGYTKYQKKNLTADTTATGTVSSLSFNNLEIGKTYRATLSTHPTQSSGTVSRYSFINGTKIAELSFYAAGAHSKSILFVSIATTLTIDAANNDFGLSAKTSTDERTCLVLEELPQHIQTNQWT